MEKIIAWLCIIILVLSGCAGSKSSAIGPEIENKVVVTDLINFTPIGTLQSEQSFKEYTVRVYRDEEETGEGSFEILKNGQRVYAQNGHKFYINGFPDDYDKEPEIGPLAMGRDITGAGNPNLVMAEWTGGAHCNFICCIFEIGTEFRKIAEINGEHSGPDFKDVNGDGKLEIIMRDWTFAYWSGCFLSSPAPEIIFRFDNSKYKLDTGLMRKPILSSAELEKIITNIKSRWRGESNSSSSSDYEKMAIVVRPIFDLVYTGNAKQAWQLFDIVWPNNDPQKNEILKDIRKALTESPYWTEIRALNYE